MRVNGILSFFSFCDVCSADCRSAFQSLYGGQFTLSTPLINQIFVAVTVEAGGMTDFNRLRVLAA